MKEEVIYVLILVFSIPLGHIVKLTRDCKQKQLLLSGTGLTLVTVLCGWQAYHTFITAFVNAVIIICVGPRRCHLISLVWCFSYLLFFRLAHHFGFSEAAGFTNAVQLILTLKMVGVAYEVHDVHELIEKSTSSDEATQALSLQYISPGLVDILHYAFCYIGIFTGPYYRYRTYEDMLNQKNAARISTIKPALKRLALVPLYAVGFLFISQYYSVQQTQDPEFQNWPFVARLWHMVPMFFIFRMRFYVAWHLAEAMCMTATLGAYPHSCQAQSGVGPTKTLATESVFADEYDFETIHNIDVYGCEVAPTVREGLRSWNTTVQAWMAHIIYRRLPIKHRNQRAFITMLVSAYWHGIYPGYYLSFLLTPFVLSAESPIMAAAKAGPSWKRYALVAFYWFSKMRLFDYMSMGFMLLTFRGTLTYWLSIFFIGHIYVGLMHLGVYLINRLIQKQPRTPTHKD